MAGPAYLKEDDWLDPIKAPGFPCLGAKAALGSNSIQCFTASDLRSDPRALSEALAGFTMRNRNQSEFAVLAAVDDTFSPSTEEEFEVYLWQVLQSLHQLDAAEWDPKYSRDPTDANFKFSFAGHAFYVVGLSPVSSRIARRFTRSVLIFNPVWQFENLRARDRLERMINQIRRRDQLTQGSINPNLRFEGTLSDAIQYSGRKVDEKWNCPFKQ